MRTAAQANRGRVLEDLVEQVLADAPGVKLFRIPVRWVPRERGKSGAFPAKGAPVDFVGVVSGVGAAIECKEVSKGVRLPLGRGRLPEAETRALREFETAGGRAFLLVAFWEQGVLVLAPFHEVDRAFLARRRASARLEELAALGGAVSVPEVQRLPKLLARLCGTEPGAAAYSGCKRDAPVV